jgi:transposase
MPRVFEREFKIDVCRAVLERGESKHSLCVKHGLSSGMLDRWIDQYRALGDQSFQGSEWRRLAVSSEQRLKQLEQELEISRLENALLRRALGEKKSHPGSDAK